MAAKKSTTKKPGKKKKKKAPKNPIRKMGAVAEGHELTSKARLILKHAHESAEGFIDSFAAVRRDRNAGQGTTTDEEQDLTRASLVFAAAGLDSALKQLIRDALPDLVRKDPAVREGLETFVQRQIRPDSADGEATYGRKFLARILTSENQLDQLIEEYIVHLTGSSLQSADELIRASQALGLPMKDVGVDKKQLKPIFQRRNKMIHELDIKLDAPIRNRESRSRAAMAKDANALLEVGERILVAVDSKLTSAN